MENVENKNRSKRPEMYHHSIDILGRRYTLAAVPTDQKDVVVVKIGAAVCSDNDNFSKRIGRFIATGRAVTSPVTFVVVDDITKYRDTVYEAFVQITKRAKNDAKILWKRNRETA